MPCWSVIENTNMTSFVQILEALSAMGAGAVHTEGDRIEATFGNRRISLWKSGEKYLAEDNVGVLPELQRKYAEVGVRRWAKKNGYGVRQKERELVLTRY